MTWKLATILFGTLLAATPVAIEILRSIVHRRRAARDGLGDTQDIARWGTLVGALWLVGTLVSAIAWALAG